MTPNQWRIGSVVIGIGVVGAALAYTLWPAGDAAPKNGGEGQAEAQAFDAGPDCIKPIVLATVGDVLLHGPLQRWASQQSDGFFAAMAPVKDLIEGADIAVANLEGPAAENLVGSNGREIAAPPTRYDGRIYDGYPLFNYHPSIIRDLQRLGVDVLQTANNHSLDRGANGIDKTLAAMAEARMPFTGTRATSVPAAGWNWSTSYTVNRGGHDYKFAFIACTYATNGLPDRRSQVLHCHDEQLLTQISALHADRGNAAVVVLPHWGDEYQPRPNAYQTGLAQKMADAGATAIVGTHPHVVQPEAMLTTRDGRRVPVVYSLGNFISNQVGLPRLSTAISVMGFTPAGEGRLAATLTGWIPLRMRVGANSVDAIDRLSDGEAGPFRTHLLRTFAADKKLPADPAQYWNQGAEVCRPGASAS